MKEYVGLRKNRPKATIKHIMGVREIPKVELHRHLEGAIRLATVADIARTHNLPLPHDNPAALSTRLQVLEPMENLEQILNAFWAAQSIFFAPEIIERVAFEAVEDAWNDGIRLLELRYSPGFMAANHNLSFDDILDAIEKGIQRAKQHYPMGVGLIAIATRELTDPMPETLLAHLSKRKDSFVGFDMAGMESDQSFPLFTPFIKKITALGFNLTMHAGEVPDSAGNVVYAIEHYGAQRIGHGLQVAGLQEEIETVISSGTTLELCPTSNYLINAVPSKAAHPLPRLLRQGVKVTINSDDPMLMGIDLTGEYKLCLETLGLSGEELNRCIQNAWEASFLPKDEKKYLRQKYFNNIIK